MPDYIYYSTHKFHFFFWLSERTDCASDNIFCFKFNLDSYELSGSANSNEKQNKKNGKYRRDTRLSSLRRRYRHIEKA